MRWLLVSVPFADWLQDPTNMTSIGRRGSPYRIAFSSHGNAGRPPLRRGPSTQVDPPTSIDYEYSRAGIRGSKIVVTTSRDPSSKLLQFAKVSSFPMRQTGDAVLGRPNAGIRFIAARRYV